MILDADVLIDLKRGHRPEALAWFASLQAYPKVSCFAASEVLFGCLNARELREVEVFLAPFPLIYPTNADIEYALSLAKFKLMGGLGLLDALTASLAVASNQPIATFNAKHFRNVPGIQLVQPYSRVYS